MQWSEVKGGKFWQGSESYIGVMMWNKGKVMCVQLFKTTCISLLLLFSVQ
jgi:hypothetical protein